MSESILCRRVPQIVARLPVLARKLIEAYHVKVTSLFEHLASQEVLYHETVTVEGDNLVPDWEKEAFNQRDGTLVSTDKE